MSRNAGQTLSSRFIKSSQRAGLIAVHNWVASAPYVPTEVVTNGSNWFMCVRPNADSSLATGNWVQLGGATVTGITPDADTATTGTLSINVQNFVSAAGGNVARALPATAPEYTTVTLTKADNSANTVSATGSIKGVGAQTLSLRTLDESVTFIADASNSWWPFEGRMSSGSMDLRYAPIWVTEILQGEFSLTGPISLGTSPFRWYAEQPLTLLSIRASLDTAPTGASAQFDFLKNDPQTSIFNVTPVNRPTISSGTNTDLAGTADTPTMTAGDYLKVQCTSIGSSVPGSNLTVQIRYKATS